MQRARTLATFGFTCTAKVPKVSIAISTYAVDDSVAPTPEIPSETNASTSTVWGPDDRYLFP